MKARASWLTVAEIAEALQVSDETVYGWLRDGSLASQRFGRQYRVRSDVFEAWCDERPSGERPAATVAPAAPAGQRRRVTRLIDIAEKRRKREAVI